MNIKELAEKAVNFIIEIQIDDDYICSLDEMCEWCSVHCIDHLRKECVIYFLEHIYEEKIKKEKR